MIDIKDKLTVQEKQAFEGLRIETTVLENLLNERHKIMMELLTITFRKLGYDVKLYGLEFNASQDRWEIKLRPDALVMPGMNRDQRHQLYKGH